jgi:small redox-active disulfide protein 2
MKIEILGDGCSRCDQLHKNVLEAVRESEKKADIVKEMDPSIIAHYGVLSLPGLAVDGVLKVSGKVLNVEEIKGLIE